MTTPRNRVSRNGRTTPKKPVVELETVATPDPPAGKLRVLKVLVQPVLVFDDGESLREVQHPTIEIKGVDWIGWSATAFDDDALETMRLGLVPLASDATQTVA